MIPRSRQHGAAITMAVVVLVLVLVGMLALYVVSRLTNTSRDASKTMSNLATAAAALDAFAASAQRLPCPADPAIDMTATPPDGNDGVERIDANPAHCTFPTGTLPWRTIGMRRDDALDSWGRKISYRVYTGNAGSLVQPGGVSMVNCDTDEATPGGVTPVAAGVGGLCKDTAGPASRNTTPAEFLNNKGLTVNDNGAVHNDAAYVLISHGSTGLGAYTVAGVQFDNPGGSDEKDNVKDTGPFTIRAFSDVDTGATKGPFFDDLVVYRTLPDLIRRAGLSARDWPDGETALKFDSATIGSAMGSPPSPGALGVGAIVFSGAGVVFGLDNSGSGMELAFGTAGGYEGLGVAGGGSPLIQSSANERLAIQFNTSTNRKFGFSLSDFGYYGSRYDERVTVEYYLGGVPTGDTSTGTACNVDGGLASFTFTVPHDFDRVDIVPIPSLNSGDSTTGITAFLVSEVVACEASVTSCRTSIDQPTNRCN